MKFSLPPGSKLAQKKIVYLGIALIMLPSCAVLENLTNTDSASAEQVTAVQGSTASVSSNQAGRAIPVIAGTSSAEQRALIDEINRDGEPVSFSAYQETVPAPVAIEGEDVVELNYEQGDLRLILEELAQALDITMVIDPSIDDRISIRTSQNRPLRRADIWPLIRLLTRDAGIILEQVGSVYNARKLPSNLPVEIVTPETLGQGTAARIMQVTPLTYVSTDAAIQALEPLLLPDGEISRLANSNLLIISASEFQLLRINQLIMLIDADPFRNQGIHLYQLSNANATEVAEELAEILLLIEGPDPAYQVRGIERINAILVTAPAARGFSEVARWVQILDADSQEQVEQLFLYKVKNLVALDLADTLSTVFEVDEEPLVPRIDEQEGTLFLPGLGEGGQPTLEQAPGTASQIAANTAVSANLTVKIVADEATNSLLIRSTARDFRQLMTTISQLDVVPLQVMINAVIAQVTLTESTRFGVDWSRVAEDAALNPISTELTTDFVPSLGGLMFTKNFLDGAARVEATLEAIAVHNDVTLLARPSLMVINNQEGEIRIGAEVPIESGQTVGSGGVTTSSIQYRPTGIELYITPQINDDGVINLIIRQVLSSVDSGGLGVNNNPIFNNQEISTTVVVRNGENVVLGGLIQTNKDQLNTGVPGLSRLPWIGKLFSYQQDILERRELFIVLRPEIINLNAEGGVQYSDILDRFELASEVIEAGGF